MGERNDSVNFTSPARTKSLIYFWRGAARPPKSLRTSVSKTKAQ